ncbi:MAG: hypothetical protein AAF628_00035 [Planctomycetota bacterium]
MLQTLTRFVLAGAMLSLAAAAPAQTCSAGGQLLKNDQYPAQLGGALPFAIVPGLCDGEAAMSIFNAGAPTNLTHVGIVYAEASGGSSASALIDIEIYDGATAFGGGRYNLGRQLFQWSAATTTAPTARSTALNWFELPFTVRVPSGQPVVGFRMVQNQAPGSCFLGYSANFATDSAATCVNGINVLDATGHGPVDPNRYLGFGLPLCPTFFRGSWMIRACGRPDPSVTWTGTPSPGNTISLQFDAPGQGFYDYLAFVSELPGTTPTPWGTINLASTPFFFCMLGPCRAILSGGEGQLSPAGTASGSLLIPPLPTLVGSGIPLHAAFITMQLPDLTFRSSSPASAPIVIQ